MVINLLQREPSHNIIQNLMYTTNTKLPGLCMVITLNYILFLGVGNYFKNKEHHISNTTEIIQALTKCFLLSYYEHPC